MKLDFRPTWALAAAVFVAVLIGCDADAQAGHRQETCSEVVPLMVVPDVMLLQPTIPVAMFEGAPIRFRYSLRGGPMGVRVRYRARYAPVVMAPAAPFAMAMGPSAYVQPACRTQYEPTHAPKPTQCQDGYCPLPQSSHCKCKPYCKCADCQCHVHHHYHHGKDGNGNGDPNGNGNGTQTTIPVPEIGRET